MSIVQVVIIVERYHGQEYGGDACLADNGYLCLDGSACFVRESRGIAQHCLHDITHATTQEITHDTTCR